MPSRHAAPSLEIRLLGTPSVSVRGAPLDVDTRRPVAVLAVIATEARPYGREELAALLWPESDDEGARGALRRMLSVLRGAVGPEALAIDRQRVALVDGGAFVDVAELDRLGASGDSADLAAAADLARGPFMAGFTLRDSPEFDDWRAARAAGVERILVTQGEHPLLVASAGFPPTLTVHDAVTGDVRTEIPEPGLGFSLLFAP